MMSNDEMIQNVFRRTDEYFEKRKKRNSVIVKGASFMSLFGVIIAAGFGLLASNIQDPVVPEESSEIQIVTTADITTEVSFDTTETATVTSLPSVQLSVTTAESGSDTVTSAAAVTTTGALSARTTVGVASSITTAVSESAKATETTASTAAIIAETTTEPAVTEPSPAATDLDKSMYNVVSVGEDFITVEIPYASDYDYMTYYNRRADSSYAYVWRHADAEFYIVTAEDDETLAEIILPEDAESIDDTEYYLLNGTSWEYVTDRISVSELVYPYMLVKGASPEELYQLEGVKNVYRVDEINAKEIVIKSWNTASVITSVTDRELMLEDFTGADGITAVTYSSEIETGQRSYEIEFEYPSDGTVDEKAANFLDICKKLLEFDAVDHVQPVVSWNNTAYVSTYLVEPVENPYAEGGKDSVDIHGRYTIEDLMAFSPEAIRAISDEAAEAYDIGIEYFYLSDSIMINTMSEVTHDSLRFPETADCSYGSQHIHHGGDGTIYHTVNLGEYRYNEIYYTPHVQGVLTMWFALNPATEMYWFAVPVPAPDIPDIGDTDGSGEADLTDAVEVLSLYSEMAAGLSSSRCRNYATADVNGDSKVTLDDVTAILTYYAQTAAGLSPSWDEIIAVAAVTKCPLPKAKCWNTLEYRGTLRIQKESK